MPTNRRAKRALSHAHNQWNGFAFTEPTAPQEREVISRLGDGEVIMRDNEILVTEIGFITMAIHTDRATKHFNALVVPGVDSNGIRGFLVLREGAAPFHSQSSSPTEAIHESEVAQLNVQTLVEAYGDKYSLHAAAGKAPWYKNITTQDINRSGLCSWGTDCFLRRFRLRTVAHHFGLPKVILKLAGPDGNQATAASLLRTENKPSNHGHPSTHLPNGS